MSSQEPIGGNPPAMFNPMRKYYNGGEYRSVSHAFADLVSGEWQFDGLELQDRVALVHALTTLMSGLMTTGWVEHTNDWDWRVTVVWGDAKLEAGTYDGEADDGSEGAWADEVALDFPDDADWEKVQYLKVLESLQSDEGGEREVLIPIMQVRTILVSQA